MLMDTDHFGVVSLPVRKNQLVHHDVVVQPGEVHVQPVILRGHLRQRRFEHRVAGRIGLVVANCQDIYFERLVVRRSVRPVRLSLKSVSTTNIKLHYLFGHVLQLLSQQRQPDRVVHLHARLEPSLHN